MSQTPPERLLESIASLAFWTLLLFLAGVVIVTGPILTSDGPGHVSMANFMVHAGDPAWPMLNRLYEFNPVPSPNALGDFLLAGLMEIVSPLTAERVVQVLCVISIPLAARLTLRRLDPDSGWIALFFFPVALERMFFLGLYNYCLSVTGCILCIWAYLRLRARVSVGNAAVLTALLLLTLACQAAGWLEAVLALGTMTATEAWLRWRAGEPSPAIMRSPIATLACLIPGALLFVPFALLGPGDRHVAYGPSPLERLIEVFRGDPFAPIGQSTAYVSLVLGLALLAMTATGFVALASASRHGCPVEHRSNTRGNTGRLSHLVMAALEAAIHVFGGVSKVVDGRARAGHDGQKAPVVDTTFNQTAVAARPGDADTRRLRFAICMLPLVFLGFLLIVPDEAGGGWTHTWRAQVFPYVGLALACGTLPDWRHLKTFAVAAAAVGSLIMIGMTLWVQVWEVPAAADEFNEADAWIGPHCTIAPVLTQFKLDPDNTARLFYHPLFHIANRLELKSDRPVLFSYLARLPIYAVRFRPGADPQRLLFKWRPSQRDTRVRAIDIAGFEAASGIPVDYVLLWDFPAADQPGSYRDIRAAVTGAHYQLVHRSSGGRMELFRRPGSGGCAKP